MRDTSALPMVTRDPVVSRFPHAALSSISGVEAPETLGVVLAGGAVPTCAAGPFLPPWVATVIRRRNGPLAYRTRFAGWAPSGPQRLFVT